MKKQLLTAASAVALSFLSASAQEIATWEDWAKSAVTFTFDDAPNETSSHTWAGEQLDKYGFKATFYYVTGWGSNWGPYRSLAQNGHEIGSHTDTHSTQFGELASSKRTIENNIGQPCLTIAYPNCNEISNTLDYYIGGRICGGQTNSKSPNNLARFDCSICGNQGINSQGQMTSKCSSANGGWVVFLIHGIEGRQANGSYSPTSASAFTGTLDWLNQNKKDYWVCTARDAIMYSRERDNASFNKTGGDSSSDSYSLTLKSDLTSNKLCNWDYPLSVRVPMQDGWSNLKVTQDGNEIEFSESNGYVYFKAVPNGGEIVVGSGKPAVPDPEFTIYMSETQLCMGEEYKIGVTMSGDAGDRTYSLNWGTGSTSTEISVSKVSASSEWENNGTPYWTVDKIMSDDGSHGKNDRWGSNGGSNEWVVFEFGKTQTVGGIMIDECTDYDVVSSFEVQYDDNGSWKTAYTGNTIGNSFNASFDPVSTSKMRLFIKEAGEGCNINYVEFSGVAGYVIKSDIDEGSVGWRPKSAGTGMLTITNSKGRVIAQSASIKVANCGGGDDPVDPVDPVDDPNDNPAVISGASNFFDENGAYFGPECEKDGSSLTGAFYTGDYTSPFTSVLGKSDADIQKKLDQLWDHYFVGSNKVYFDKGSESYILDTGNNDVRSEGMSYGMMICVQTNHKSEFDKLWTFAKNHMWHKSGQWDGYFAWQCGTDGNVKDQNCAPDGEMYFMMSLLFAAHRWNDDSYMKDAQYILEKMWKNGNGSLFNEQHKIVTFQPYNCSDFSDPSYDLPGFVDLFARWSTTNNSKWSEAATATRGHLIKSSNSSSGLFTDYNNFDGTPKSVDYNNNSHKYMYDAMRCAMNVGMDYYWFGADAKNQETIMKRLIDFFEKDGYQHARFNWDGSGAQESYTLGETGANAVACYALMNDASYASKVKTNLNKAWNAGLATGQYRYYDGLVHYLSMLHLCGSFKIWKPAPSIKEKTVEGNTYQGTIYKESTTFTAFEGCQLYNISVKVPSDPNSIQELSNVSNGIGIAPNPTKDYFVVVSDNAVGSVDIIGLDGRIILSDRSGNQKFDTSDLPAGSYIVRVALADGNGIEYLRLVISK